MPCFIIFCFIVFYCVFYKLKVCGHPTLRKSIGVIFPVFIHFMSLCYVLLILSIFQALHQQKDYNLLKAQMMVRILKQQTILKLSYAVVLLDMHCILNKQQYSVNINLTCIGKPKKFV